MTAALTDATIFALASAPGRAGVAVFRISGPRARDVIVNLCTPNALPPPRQASLRSLCDPTTKEVIDHVITLFFEAPHSFTGEDVVELHTHGGRAVCAGVTQLLQRLPHFRLAEPGEFTRRAFENNKMDLTEAEAIADLVHAETEAQRKQALRQLDGALGKLYDGWRDLLVRCLAYMEAAIDFADEELPTDLVAQQTGFLHELRSQIAAHLNDNHRGERLRNGFTIALIGAPNAGKSSLLNALAKRDAAIVSATPGTTRDVIDVHIDIGGYPVIISDTAGLRLSTDAIESEGIRRTHQRAEQADLKLLILDASAPHIDETTAPLVDERTIVILNKIDLVPPNLGNSAQFSFIAVASDTILSVSALTGVGISDLIGRLEQEIILRYGTQDAPPLTRARHRAALQECLNHLDRALAVLQTDMRAEDMRLAMRALGRITGRVDVEDLLDIIFRDFCLGK